MKTHTTAPWAISLNGNEELSIWSTHPAQNIICVVKNVPHENNIKENAKLIVNAPELFDALNSIVDYMRMCGNDGPNLPSINEELTHIYKTALNAVQKIDKFK